MDTGLDQWGADMVPSDRPRPSGLPTSARTHARARMTHTDTHNTHTCIQIHTYNIHMHEQTHVHAQDSCTHNTHVQTRTKDTRAHTSHTCTHRHKHETRAHDTRTYDTCRHTCSHNIDTGVHTQHTHVHTQQTHKRYTHTCRRQADTRFFSRCLTFLLRPLGFSVLVLALLSLMCPFRKLLPSWEGKGLGVTCCCLPQPVDDGAPREGSGPSLFSTCPQPPPGTGLVLQVT